MKGWEGIILTTAVSIKVKINDEISISGRSCTRTLSMIILCSFNKPFCLFMINNDNFFVQLFKYLSVFYPRFVILKDVEHCFSINVRVLQYCGSNNNHLNLYFVVCLIISWSCKSITTPCTGESKPTFCKVLLFKI